MTEILRILFLFLVFIILIVCFQFNHFSICYEFEFYKLLSGYVTDGFQSDPQNIHPNSIISYTTNLVHLLYHHQPKYNIYPRIYTSRTPLVSTHSSKYVLYEEPRDIQCRFMIVMMWRCMWWLWCWCTLKIEVGGGRCF